MRLIELKCKNCGAKLKIEDNVKKVTCKYCNTEFSVEDAYNDGYNFEKGRMKAQTEQLEEINNIMTNNPIFKNFFQSEHSVIIPAVISIIIFLSIYIFITTSLKSMNSIDSFEVERFNNSLEIYVGTNNGIQVSNLIDEVQTNNRKNKDKLIEFEYKDVKTKNPDEIIKIKKDLDDWSNYEITFEYNEDGIINYVLMEEVE